MTLAKFGHIRVAFATYLCVGVLQFTLLFPLHRTMDLPTWDEAVTLGQGDQFIHGGTLGALAGSPVHALLYSLFDRAFGTVESIFYMQYFVKISVSLLLLRFLSIYLRSHLIALLITMIWLVSSVNLSEVVLVYHVALGVFLFALISLERSKVLALLLLCLCALTRLEYLFPATALAGYTVWKSRSGNRKAMTRPEIAASVLFAALVYYVVLNLGDFNVGGERTWFAFNQHYSRHEVEAGRYSLNPYIDSNIVIQADFPGAGSLREAFVINPRAFTRHVARNVALLPGAVIRFVSPYSTGMPAKLFDAWVGFAVTALTLASVVQVGFFRRLLTAIRRRRRMLYSTVVSATALIPILLVDPLAHYTLIMVPFVLFWLGFVCLEGLGAIGVRDFPRRVLIVLNVLFALGIVASGKPYATANGVRPVLSEVRQLIEIWPKGRMIVMGVGSGWYVGYLGSQRVTPIEPLGTVYGGRIQEGSDSLYSLIGRYSPDVVLINRDLTASKNFRTDSLAALRPDQWAQCSLGEDKWYFRVGKADTRAKCFSDAPSQYPARY